MMASPETLHRASLLSGVRALARRDRRLARLVARYGPPPLWARRPGFATLLHIILEQQVSLASARALYLRLASTVRPFGPPGILSLGTPGLPGARPDATEGELRLRARGSGYERGTGAASAEDVLGCRGAAASHASAGDRAMDGQHLPADGPATPRHLAAGRSGTAKGAGTSPWVGFDADPRRGRAHHRSLATAPRGRGSDSLARVFVGVMVWQQYRSATSSMT